MRRALSVVLAASLAFLAGCSTYSGGRANPRQPGGIGVVLIDPGHGGDDRGGAGHGMREKDMALDTARRLRDELGSLGIRSQMTREEDRSMMLDERVALANSRAGSGVVLVSLHYDAGPRSESGVVSFFWRTDSHGLATRIHRSLVAETGFNDRRVVRRRLRLTRNPEVPCVLIECGFLTNPGNASQIAQPEFRQRIAKSIARGIAEQARLGDGSIPPVPELNEPLSQASDRREY